MRTTGRLRIAAAACLAPLLCGAAVAALLRDLGHGPMAQRIIDSAAHSWSRWTQSPQVLAQVRNRLAAAIETYQP